MRQRSTHHLVPRFGDTSFDYIVVGGGLSGSVLAARLTENRHKRVLLLEAGSASTLDPLVRVPAGLLKLFGKPAYDWCHHTQPERHANARKIFVSRGRMLGGSTCLNAQIALRGEPSDYNAWRVAGWRARDVRPVFDAIELRDSPRAMQSCGLQMQLPRFQHDLSRRFLNACATVRKTLGNDVDPLAHMYQSALFNSWGAHEQEAVASRGGQKAGGFGRFELTQRRGVRWTAATSYLAAAARRPGLNVEVGHVSRVLLDGRGCRDDGDGDDDKVRAVGVELADGRRARLADGGSVVLASGALGSPTVLERSGIGARRALERAGIRQVVNLPAVGRGLQDHPAVLLSCESSVSDVVREIRPFLPLCPAISPWAILSWITRGSGPLATTGCDHGAFLKTAAVEAAQAPADVQLRFVPGIGPSADGVESYRQLGDGRCHPRPGFTFQVIACRPRSRGSVHVASADPLAPPVIKCNYLAASEDRESLLQGLRLARRLAASGALGAVHRREVHPGVGVASDAQLDAYIRKTLHSGNGISGGCCLNRVVDRQLRVRGVDGLHVCDASVMPRIVGAQLAMPTLMIAERGASFVTRDCEERSERLARRAARVRAAGTAPEGEESRRTSKSMTRELQNSKPRRLEQPRGARRPSTAAGRPLFR